MTWKILSLFGLKLMKVYGINASDSLNVKRLHDCPKRHCERGP